MNKMKRFISWVLICVMIFSFASISYAVDSETVTPQDSESSTESIPSIEEARV